MTPRPVLLLVAGIALAGAGPAGSGAIPGVYDAEQAHVDYMLKCQGCHRPDGSGDDHSNPPMRGVVARFLSVPGGRQFLGRVPGVATTNLDDTRLANLLNWTLYRFDRGHVPGSFRPYTAAELGALRQNPIRLERVDTRARLVAGFTTAETR
jgi:hypothetical protein